MLVHGHTGCKRAFPVLQEISFNTGNIEEMSVVQLNALFLEQGIETRWGEAGYTAGFGDIVVCEGYEIKEVLLLDIGIN